MSLSRRNLVGASLLATTATATRVFAQAADGDNTIRIGLLEDMSGPYRDITGPTSVVCTQQAVREFTAANPEIKVELLTAAPRTRRISAWASYGSGSTSRASSRYWASATQRSRSP